MKSNNIYYELGNEEIELLLVDIEKKYGYDFLEYSRASLKRRINRFIEVMRLPGFAELRYNLLYKEDFFESFVQELTVNTTEMFRDPAFYKVLREKVIPQLSTYPNIRIWHAGCSTGEEVFSMAILLKEENLLEKTTLYATDLDQRVIKSAKSGMFSMDLMQKSEDNYILSGGKNDFSSYYTVTSETAKFKKDLSNRMVFSIHNLVTDQSFNEFQLIVCRNVLIYFNSDLQNKVLQLLKNSLVRFGFLALGSKETIYFSEIEKDFLVISKRHRIWKKFVSANYN